MRTDRDRHEEALDDLDLLQDEQSNGTTGLLLITQTCSSYPSAGNRVYCCRPVFVDAADTEGATPSFTMDPTVLLYAVNIGTAIPPSGTYVIGINVGGRTVFNYNG